MKRTIQNLFLLLLLVLPTTLWAQLVERDASFRMGRLSNGLTYYIRHNAKEPGIADFYIAQRVGSILEEPRQRGLAHFLEHMAFNGTQNFRGDSTSLGIVPWCETIGVKFGANLNAYTSVEQTVYNVSAVPVKRETVIDSVLLILHDWSHCLLLLDKEIDKERGVIHEEWRTRRAGMATQRMIERVLPVVYKGTKYEDCLPIGSMDIVDHFPYQDLKDYYQKWYRPDLQAIVVVGDINVDQMEEKIKSLFSRIPKPQNPAKRVYYPVNDNKKMIVAVEKDSEQPIMLATLLMKHNVTPDSKKNTVKYQEDGYVEQLITYMLNERLSDIKRRPQSPFLSASVHSGTFLVSRTKDAFSLSLGCRQENIKGSFDAAVGALEQARRYGFTESELARAKAVRLKAAERRYAERNDRTNRYFVQSAVSHFLSSEPMTTAAYDLQLVKQFDRSITLAKVNAATRQLISDRNQVLVVYAPDKPNFHLPAAESLESYVLQAQAQSYSPYKDDVVSDRLISHLPQPGTIKSETDYGKFGVKKLTLSNGVEVYVKPTDFNKDQINMRFYGEGGTSLYPDSDAINFHFIAPAITDAGVGRFDNSALNKLLASKTVRVAPAIGDETQTITGASSVKDLSTMLQLTWLYFTQPRKDTAAFVSNIDRTRSFLTNRDANPQVAYNDSLLAIYYGNHLRTRPITADRLKEVSYDKILNIYRDRFSDASGFKMILVGNVNLDTLRPLLCQYIASLPAKGRRDTFADSYPKVRNVDETHLFKKKMNTPSALVTILYTFPRPYTAKSDLALDVFKRVLSIAYTDSVREEKGGTYGVSIDAELDKNTTPNTVVRISFRTDPTKYAELIPIIYRQIAHIAQQGPVESSLDKVKKYLLKNYQQNTINNGYWDYVLYNDLRNGVDFHTGYDQMVKTLAPSDVQQVAKDLLNARRRIEVTMLSE